VPDLTGMPPALVLVADLDPIADSVVEYADRLAAAGVDTRLVRFPGMMHAFVTMGHFFHLAYDAMDESVAGLSVALAGGEHLGDDPSSLSSS
jgi:acetyl esterase